MSTQAENEQDPVWLHEQMGRYKAECSAVTRERDALLQQCKALEVQLADASQRLAKAEAWGADILKASEAQAKQHAERQEAQAKRVASLSGELTAQRATGQMLSEQLHAAVTLAAKRKAALGSVMSVVGKVIETVVPLLDEK